MTDKTPIADAPAAVACPEGLQTMESTCREKPAGRRFSAVHPNRVIFCDVDGVLITPRCHAIGHSGTNVPADPSCVQALNRIAEATGAVIVVSSTWRFGGLMFCREKFHDWGVKAPVVDVTPRLLENPKPDSKLVTAKTRGEEIDAWLRQVEGFIEVNSFVILDDDADMGFHGDRLIRTNFHEGLTQAHASLAVEVLRRPYIRKSLIEVSR